MNHFISLSQAVTMTQTYRDQRTNVLDGKFQGQDLLPLSETFDRAAFEELLSKTGCEALRIYYGMDDSYKVHAIIVPVDGNNADILPSQQANVDAGDDIVEQSRRCPDDCPPPSVLNEP